MEEFWISFGICKVWYFWRINKLKSGHWFIFMIWTLEGDLEDVGIYGDLWLAVKLRFRTIGMVERENLIFNYVYCL